MSTNLEDCMIELSKQIGDYWAGTTTTGTDALSVIDTALIAKDSNDWITDEAYDRLTSGTYDEEERKITSFLASSGDLTVLAHGGTVASGVTYEVHRLFNASEKRRALVHAAKAGFPHIFRQVRDESRTAGNWLRNGDQENWAQTTYADYWRASTVTAAENTTAPYFYRGASSVQLSGSTGYYYQSNTQVSDLMDLAGEGVTFTAKGYASAASSLRLAIYDGTTYTYSDFHAGDSKEELLTVTATIAAAPSQVSFRAYYTTGATVYVDDFRVTGPSRDKVYIGDLGLALNHPHQVWQASDSNLYREPWVLLRDYKVGSDGYLYCGSWTQGNRLRIIGIGYLDFYDTAGAVGTDWADTIAIDSPQTEILVAEAAKYLYSLMIMPNWTAGESNMFSVAYQHWKSELRDRRAKYGMGAPSATVHWG